MLLAVLILSPGPDSKGTGRESVGRNFGHTAQPSPSADGGGGSSFFLSGLNSSFCAVKTSLATPAEKPPSAGAPIWLCTCHHAGPWSPARELSACPSPTNQTETGPFLNSGCLREERMPRGKPFSSQIPTELPYMPSKMPVRGERQQSQIKPALSAMGCCPWTRER